MSSASSAAPPTKQLAIDHLKQARQNYKLYGELKTKGEHPDWAVTVLFYTALHLVQAYLVESAKTGFDIPEKHERRISLVHQKLHLIGPHYERMFKLSMVARYHMDQPRPTAQ